MGQVAGADGVGWDEDVGPTSYDAFVCYNSEDEEDARRITRLLMQHHVRVFEASTALRGGDVWMTRVASAVRGSKAALVLLGKGGAQRWAGLELQELLRQHETRKMRIIPVLLPGASSDPDVPFLGGFTRVDFRDRRPRNLRALLEAIHRAADQDSFGGASPRPAEPRSGASRPIIVAVAAVALVVAAIQARPRWWPGPDETISRRIGVMIERGDWRAVERLADEGDVAVVPLDERLLARYHGEGTASAVRALIAIARHQPNVVCPRLADIVGLGAKRRDPLLTYEEVLSQVADSPCSARSDMHEATQRSTSLIRQALNDPKALATVRARFGPRFDCAALERLRVSLAVTGPQDCSASAPAREAQP